MSLSDEEVKKVAQLAALDLKEEEVPEVKEQLNSIISYVDRLSEIPTRGVEPTFHVHGETNVFREDVVQASYEKGDLEKNAPDFSDGFFRVPQIIKNR